MSRCRIVCHRLSTPPSRELAWRPRFIVFKSRLAVSTTYSLFNRNLQPKLPFLSAVSKCVHLRGFNSSTQSLKMPKYSPEKDIPDLAGKVILVTGGTFLSNLSARMKASRRYSLGKVIKINFLQKVLSSPTNLKNPLSPRYSLLPSSSNILPSSLSDYFVSRPVQALHH